MTNEELKKTTAYDEAMKSVSEALALENKYLREKIHEYKMIYGIEKPQNDEVISELIDLMTQSFDVLSEQFNKSELGVMKKACVDIREYAIKLIGALSAMEQMKIETVDRLIKRQLKEDK